MHDSLAQATYFVREHVGLFKAANNYDVLDPQSGQVVLECREPELGLLTKLLRFTKYKRMTPFDIRIGVPGGPEVIQIKRGWSLFLSKVDVIVGGRRIGGFQQKFFSIGGKFDVLDDQDRKICTLQGNWTSWDFRFLAGDRQLGAVTKKWAGLGKELFTTADNYVLTIAEDVGREDPVRALIMAAVMCIDMVLKE
jgi:uncharacterized protein YxjI